MLLIRLVNLLSPLVSVSHTMVPNFCSASWETSAAHSCRPSSRDFGKSTCAEGLSIVTEIVPTTEGVEEGDLVGDADRLMIT
jgi:hypothetical protein